MATVPKSSRVLETTLASASAGPFALGFRVFDTDGFDVYVDGVRQTVSTDYSVSASFSDGYDDAATITFTETLGIGTEIVVYGKMVADRETDYFDGDANLTLKLNTELARIIAMISEGQRDIKSAVRIIGNDNASLEPEALGLIGFDGSGNLTVLTGAADATVSVAMAPVVAASTLALARAAMAAQTQGDVLDDLNTLGANAADGEFLVGTGAGALAWKKLATAVASLGLSTASLYADYGGTANAITLTTGLSLSALTAGQEFRFRATNVNAAGGTTINVDGIGAVTAKTVTGAALPAKHVRTGMDTVCRFDGTDMIVITQPRVLISETTISNDAALDFVLDNANYNNFELELLDVVPATDNVSLDLYTSSDGGSSFDSGASDYNRSYFIISGASGVSSTAASSLALVPAALGSSANEYGASGTVRILDPGSARYTRVQAKIVYSNTSLAATGTIMMGHRSSNADVDAVRISASSGNLESGTVRLWGLL